MKHGDTSGSRAGDLKRRIGALSDLGAAQDHPLMPHTYIPKASL